MHCDVVVLPRHITKPGPSKAPQRPSPELRAKEMENEASTAQTNHWFGRAEDSVVARGSIDFLLLRTMSPKL
ncbi:uncharacterized protein BDCG_17805 [Blastomyces dermatitidis ER-3]|uniref:Uncharacterized protein n=2 Tax=Ajellomyces dermatitidis TaxID=5039 RepID=F2T566_AJEDA|nr:uncharacterized protein BDCG_17805 [Blastomyces dermatitidis ER-3]EGE78291.1 hypothetical protein BDDG_01228 [Blastomyces dermatitidis ATCC 18188]OAT02854.1 hypothetical protein BDCG_17805 [Blastomyces dermatitidis ER-3]